MAKRKQRGLMHLSERLETAQCNDKECRVLSEKQLDELDTALVTRFVTMPSTTPLFQAKPISIGAASGKLVLAQNLEEELRRGTNTRDIILVVNGDVPYDKKTLWSDVGGVLFTKDETAAQTTHFAIDLKTLGVPAVFRRGTIKYEEGSIRFNGDVGLTVLSLGDVVSMDAATGAVYKGATKVDSPSTLQYARTPSAFLAEPKKFKKFKEHLAVCTRAISDEQAGLGLSIGVNAYTPEQLRIGSNIHPGTYLNLLRTENYLLTDPDRRTFQALFSLIYARQLIDEVDSPLSRDLSEAAELYAGVIDTCIPALLNAFKSQQTEHLKGMFREYYARTNGSTPNTMQVRFLDPSLTEIFPQGGRDFKSFMFSPERKAERQAFRVQNNLPDGKFEALRNDLVDAVFDALVKSPDYQTELRGVRMMRRAPQVYESQVDAFLTAYNAVTSEFADFSKKVDVVFYIPYVTSPPEVENVVNMFESAAQEKGSNCARKLGVLLELHQAARYVDSFLEMGIRHFMIGSNDLIANWNGMSRAEGIHFGDETVDKAVIGNFRDYLRTISKGMRDYADRTGVEMEQIANSVFMTLSGELPARILKEILSCSEARYIKGIGLPAMKLPHVARTLYDGIDDINRARKNTHTERYKFG